MSDEPWGDCDFCGEESRAGGVTKGYSVRVNDQKSYLMLCPVAVKNLEDMGMFPRELKNNGSNTFDIDRGGTSDDERNGEWS